MIQWISEKNLNQSPKQDPRYSDIHIHRLNLSRLDVMPPRFQHVETPSLSITEIISYASAVPPRLPGKSGDVEFNDPNDRAAELPVGVAASCSVAWRR
jgi:hypothetical protein